MNKPKTYYFLSFVNPETRENVGVVIIDAPSIDEALKSAWSQGINPGGEVSFAKIEHSELEENDLELNRHYTKEQMNDRGYLTIKQHQNRLHEN